MHVQAGCQSDAPSPPPRLSRARISASTYSGLIHSRNGTSRPPYREFGGSHSARCLPVSSSNPGSSCGSIGRAQAMLAGEYLLRVMSEATKISTDRSFSQSIQGSGRDTYDAQVVLDEDGAALRCTTPGHCAVGERFGEDDRAAGRGGDGADEALGGGGVLPVVGQIKGSLVLQRSM